MEKAAGIASQQKESPTNDFVLMGKALPTRQKRHVKQIPKMEEWSKNQPDRQKDNCQTSSTRMAKESVLTV